MLLCLLWSATAGAQTNVRAWHADGQTWIVWEDAAPQPFTYEVYRSSSPISDLGTATFVGRLFYLDWVGARLRIADQNATWRIPDGSSGTYVIAADEGVFVYTPHEAVSEYFAVVKEGETAVGPDNTAGPVAQTTDPVQCHWQLHSETPSGKPFDLYAHWTDGREDPDSGRTDYPVMGSRFTNGTGNIFAIMGTPPDKADDPLPAVLAMHGGGPIGSFADFGDRFSQLLQIDTVVPDGLFVSLDDNIFVYQELAPDYFTVYPETTRWYGYIESFNRFEIPAGPPADDAVVVNYTLRRIAFITDWLIDEMNVDPMRVSLLGFSGGGGGAGFMTRWMPEKYSAAILPRSAAHGNDQGVGALHAGQQGAEPADQHAGRYRPHGLVLADDARERRRTAVHAHRRGDRGPARNVGGQGAGL
ncbi:MAG: hypothetical protein M5R36_26340 [Deltaproteobacteria bacterium]|nr:hypothetical protein [Deltaproteobacteria bacterium]